MFRLRTDIWVSALLRRANAAGAQAVLVHRGDDDGGAVFVRINRLDGTSTLLAAMTDMDDARIWSPLGVANAPDADIDALIKRERARDPDAWVVEIEDREGRHFIEERVSLPTG